MIIIQGTRRPKEGKCQEERRAPRCFPEEGPEVLGEVEPVLRKEAGHMGPGQGGSETLMFREPLGCG